PAVPAGPSVREGESDPRLPLVQASLVLHGDLDPAQAQRSPTVHEGALVAALKRFQARHGITVDGILGADTVKTLNTSLDERITQVVANLERLRWDPPLPRTGKAIEVNVPEYRLTAYEDGAPALDMRVVVGTEENRTPLFTDYMDDVVLNPTWTVPYSIAREEILPKLRADPAYTIGQNMDIYASWNQSAPVVDPWSVDWWAVNGRNMSYRFVERAGPGNALGRVRFSLNNDFAIYLHDTPAKSKFDRPHRAYSHGCVRVGDYDALLGFVAGDQAERLRGLLDTGRTMTMKLPRNVDVRIVYHSAWVDELGTAHFRRDVYGLDPEVAQRLREGSRGLIALKRQDVGLK
ncbi:MAG: L,D-transpeptidase family protein, partial [Caenispirillum bisanense]|nr:L,D-transpeptidase family protein [Caenispirillum bisanense]MCA1974487.1 L,D-transpeptidase family protein [Caenispirillum sp.]